MSIILHMRPRDKPCTWDDFCHATPPFSIALDGYVNEGPRFDPSGPRRNFNHHEGVPRFETRATCAQVLIRLRTGLFERFHDAHGPHAHVFVNDCDEDVCLSWFLLNRASIAEQTVNPILNRLVGVIDMLDTTAGAYPYPREMEFQRELAWVFDPYRQFRLSGDLDRKDPGDYTRVVHEVELRIMAHIAGRGEKVSALDTRYEVIGGGAGWVMVRELGAQARTGMFADGIRAFVSVRERPDGRWVFVLGRMSDDIPFDIPAFLQRANQLEATYGDTDDFWGGSDTIGGSPRVRGSLIPPNEFERNLNKWK